MPRKPAPILEVIYAEDEQSDHEARLAALDLLISFILEDRALAEDAGGKVDARNIA